MCADSATLPVLLPGLDELKIEAPDVSWDTELEVIGRTLKHIPADLWNKVLYFGVVIFPVFVCLVIPAWLYRLSLKSTALLWSPLVWAFRPIGRSEDPSQFARRNIHLSIYKFSRIYSSVVICLFGMKIMLWLSLNQLSESMINILGYTFVSRFVVPTQIVTWHIAAAVNAVLTWVIYFKSEAYIHDVSANYGPDPRSMERFFKVTFYFRNIISLYTVFCLIYIAVSLIISSDLPQLRIILLP